MKLGTKLFDLMKFKSQFIETNLILYSYGIVLLNMLQEASQTFQLPQFLLCDHVSIDQGHSDGARPQPSIKFCQ